MPVLTQRTRAATQVTAEIVTVSASGAELARPIRPLRLRPLGNGAFTFDVALFEGETALITMAIRGGDGGPRQPIVVSHTLRIICNVAPREKFVDVLLHRRAPEDRTGTAGRQVGDLMARAF